MANLYEKTQSHADAIDTLIKGLENNPNSNVLKLELAHLYQNNAEFVDALKCYSQVLSVDKANPTALYNVAVIKTQMEKFSEADMIYATLLKMPEENLRAFIFRFLIL